MRKSLLNVLSILALVGLVMVTGCKKEEESTVGDAVDQAEGAADEAADAADEAMDDAGD